MKLKNFIKTIFSFAFSQFDILRKIRVLYYYLLKYQIKELTKRIYLRSRCGLVGSVSTY